MGYRSEVALTIKNEDFENLIARAKNENTGAYELIQNARLFKNEKYTTIYWGSIKWYDGYEHIDFITDFYDEIPHVFNRIGDDVDDNEYGENIYGNGNDYEYCDMMDCAYISRRMDVESAGEEFNIF